MSHHDRAASTMGPPPAKAADANTIADHSSISTASSPALADITSVSPTNSAPLVKPENASNKSFPTVPAAQHESPEERVARFLKFVKNSTPEEISAMARKCGLQVIGGEPIPFDTDEDAPYHTNEKDSDKPKA
ncbi:hypothetical protein GTR04_4160 [Trichophyton interdigitale]|uniref:Uncharacterized protein n=1 Tax=Trichophyton interdigitale TaxID=101480 RepID=A0A9P4YDW8_9EURO|nr:hypothetical protein GY631_4942 [Trichophyton interdigitale]KAF3892289.1 hypothetical protein GY632_4739 [Trichophyton interdigitale]KAG8208448.1 hypothetical protein GTR04_4160 [Trichophyton interdigitale]